MEKFITVILIAIFIINVNGRSQRISDNQWFRDRHGNSIEISNYTARFVKARSPQSVPIFTKDADDVLKMISDYQRSIVLLMAGSFRSQVGRGPGNLYIIFTDKIQYCNGSVVAHEVAGDSVLSDITSENRNNDVRLDFGHMGEVTISKSLLVHVLKKVDVKKSYHDLNCREDVVEAEQDAWIDVRQQEGSQISGNTNNPQNSNQALGQYENNLNEIIAKHNEILAQTKSIMDNYAKSLENIVTNLQQTIKRIKNNSPSAQERIPSKPNMPSNDFEGFVRRKINTVCSAKSQLPISKNITVSDAQKWRDDLLKKEEIIETLQKQLDKIIKNRKVNLSSRFGDDEDITAIFSYIKITPNSAVSREGNYSCLLDSEVDNCIELFKPIRSVNSL